MRVDAQNKGRYRGQMVLRVCVCVWNTAVFLWLCICVREECHWQQQQQQQAVYIQWYQFVEILQQ